MLKVKTLRLTPETLAEIINQFQHGTEFPVKRVELLTGFLRKN